MTKETTARTLLYERIVKRSRGRAFRMVDFDDWCYAEQISGIGDYRLQLEWLITVDKKIETTGRGWMRVRADRVPARLAKHLREEETHDS